MPGSGRSAQAATPWHRRIRRDLLAWGALAGVCAGLVLGLTGGGWGRGARPGCARRRGVRRAGAALRHADETAIRGPARRHRLG